MILIEILVGAVVLSIVLWSFSYVRDETKEINKYIDPWDKYGDWKDE